MRFNENVWAEKILKKIEGVNFLDLDMFFRTEYSLPREELDFSFKYIDERENDKIDEIVETLYEKYEAITVRKDKLSEILSPIIREIKEKLNI